MSLWSLWLLVYRPWGLGLVSYYVYVYMYIYICICDNSVCICRHIGMFFFFLGGSVATIATCRPVSFHHEEANRSSVMALARIFRSKIEVGMH